MRGQDYEEGRVKHVRAAVRVARSDGPDAETGLAYLHALAVRQVEAGAQYLDVNVDEYSHRPHEQIEAMEWLVGVLAPIVRVPLSIDSSSIEIIRAGMDAAAGDGGAADAQLRLAGARRRARARGPRRAARSSSRRPARAACRRTPRSAWRTGAR